jgi:hypothetical protein
VNSLNFCKIYEQVLIFFLLLPALCFNAAPLTTHRWCFPRLPAAPSPLFLRHLALNSPARRSTNPASFSSRGRVAPLPARAATWVVDHQQLLAATHAPLFSIGTCPVNFSFFYSCARTRIPVLFPRSTTSPELLCPPPSAASATPPLQFRAPPAPPHLTAPS